MNEWAKAFAAKRGVSDFERRPPWTSLPKAARVPRLELILGGHSHDTLPEPELVGGVAIVHAGPYGAFASRTELVKDATGRARIAGFALESLSPPRSGTA